MIGDWDYQVPTNAEDQPSPKHRLQLMRRMWRPQKSAFERFAPRSFDGRKRLGHCAILFGSTASRIAQGPVHDDMRESALLIATEFRIANVGNRMPQIGG